MIKKPHFYDCLSKKTLHQLFRAFGQISAHNLSPNSTQFMGSASFCGEGLNSCKDFLHSKEEQLDVGNSTEVCPEELDLCIERLGMGIGASVVKEV